MIDWDVTSGDTGVLYDASGRKIPDAIKAHLDSGLVEHFVRGLDGNLVLNKWGNAVARDLTLYPAPLQFEQQEETHELARQTTEDSTNA